MLTIDNNGNEVDENGKIVRTADQIKKDSESNPKVEKKDDKIIVVDGVEYVVQDHVNQLVGSARTEGKQAGKTEAEKAAEKAREKEREQNLTEQGQYKDLYEAEQKKVTDLQTKLDEANGTIQGMQTDSIRTKVAAKYGLPSEIADRIRGEDETEMDADAKLLSERMGVVKPVDTQTGKGGKGQKTGSESEDDDDVENDQTPKHEQKKAATTYGFQTPGEVSW